MAYGMMGQGSGPFAGYGWVFQIVIVVLLVLIFWWLLRGQRYGYGANTQEKPMMIVQRRYAAGEITKKEYDRLKKDLGE